MGYNGYLQVFTVYEAIVVGVETGPNLDGIHMSRNCQSKMAEPFSYYMTLDDSS